MTCSLIITTYNWHEALELSLFSVFKQSTLPLEIIIADDGSKEETKKLIQKMQSFSPVLLIHSWQEDDGFRVAASRNRAIAKASGEYIIIIDGDMILHHHFIKDHIGCAQESYFIQGSRGIMSPAISQEILQNKTSHILTPFLPQLRNRLNTFYIPLLSKLICNRSTQKHKGIRTCNISMFKDDIIKVNGFNEDFVTWGREDSEFVERLYNIGIHRKNLKFGGIQFHIYHKEGSSSTQNNAILQKAIDTKLTWCDNGIDKYLKVRIKKKENRESRGRFS